MQRHGWGAPIAAGHDILSNVEAGLWQLLKGLTPDQLENVFKAAWHTLINGMISAEKWVSANTSPAVKEVFFEYMQKLAENVGAQQLGQHIKGKIDKMRATGQWTENDDSYWESLLDKLQTRLDFVGMIPGVGNVADIGNAYISLIRLGMTGDPKFKVQAAKDLMAAVPVAGIAAAVTKTTKVVKSAAKTAKAAQKATKTGSALEKAAGTAKGALRGAKKEFKKRPDYSGMTRMQKLVKVAPKKVGLMIAEIAANLGLQAIPGGLGEEPLTLPEDLHNPPKAPPKKPGSGYNYWEASPEWLQWQSNVALWQFKYRNKPEEKQEWKHLYDQFSDINTIKTKWPQEPPKKTPAYYHYARDISLFKAKWARTAKEKQHYKDEAKKIKRHLENISGGVATK